MRHLVIWSVAILAMAGNAFGLELKKNLKDISIDLGGGVKMELVFIPAGEFVMGCADSDKDATNVEKPQHRVRITKAFYLGKYPVTQEQWKAVMGNNPSDNKGPKNPVGGVTWDDCQQFLGLINLKFGAGRGKFQLPTEAQREYACRAGSKTKYYFGDDQSRLDEYAWYDGNFGSEITHPVGKKKPNSWGLYDMQGNVWEWCQDWFGEDYYKKSVVENPTGPKTGKGARGSRCLSYVPRPAMRVGRTSQAAARDPPPLHGPTCFPGTGLVDRSP